MGNRGDAKPAGPVLGPGTGCWTNLQSARDPDILSSESAFIFSSATLESLFGYYLKCVNAVQQHSTVTMTSLLFELFKTRNTCNTTLFIYLFDNLTNIRPPFNYLKPYNSLLFDII